MILIHSGRPSIGPATSLARSLALALSLSFSFTPVRSVSLSLSRESLFLFLSLPTKYAIYSRARHTIGRDLDTIRAVLNSTFRRFGPFFLLRLYAPNPQPE